MWIFFTACAPPPEAPAELGELSRFLFRELGGDEALLAEGLVNLDALLADIDLSASHSDRSYTLPLLDEADVEGLERPERSLSDSLGLSLAAQSIWPVEDHAAYQVLADLTDASPGTTSFQRTFVDDPECFADRSCTTLRTVNTIVRENALTKMTFNLHKDYRWVSVEPLGWAVISRGWTPTSTHGDDGSNHIWQQFELDIFLPDGSGSSRFVGIWMEPDYAILDAETVGNLTLQNIDETMAHVDAWLAE